MKIKFSKRIAAILFAAGVSASLRACNGTLVEAKQPDPRPTTTIESIEERYNTKEGYILDSNFDLVGQEEKEVEEDKVR